MSKIVRKKDLDVLIENTMAKAGIIKEEDPKSKFLDAFSGQDPFTMLIVDLMTKLVEKLEDSILKDVDLPNKIKASGYNNFDDYYLDKYGKTFTSELEELETSLGNSKPEIKNYLADKIQMLKWSVEGVNKKLNESKLNIGKLINEGDYYGSFGDMGKWYDEQDREYEMEDGDWDEDEYATWEEYSNSPYGASASNRWSINPSAKSGGWDPEMAFNQYVDTHGPMRVRRRKMTQPDMMESKSNKKPLINENVQKELGRFNRLSNYTFKK